MKYTSTMIKLFALIAAILLVHACRNHVDSLTEEQSVIVKDSVQQMIESIAKTISHEGPLAWLAYFENSPDFYMAADGRLVFPDRNAATNFLKNTYAKSVRKIELKWKDVRIDPLGIRIASVGAMYHEDVTDITGKMFPSDGYFTAIAEQTTQGWQLRNAHWSMIPSK